jgi:chromate reductase, NAD(P)H dehydrogenase (quinone)
VRGEDSADFRRVFLCDAFSCPDRGTVRFLAISGSLRAGSSNTGVLQAIASVAPAAVEIVSFRGLAEIPAFNPDLDVEPGPLPVEFFRSELKRSQAVLISTPEYVHGLPGSLKNALDWIVRSGELYEKPIALINPSPRSTFAQAALTEVLNTMSARIIQEACLTLPMSSPLTPPGILADSQLSSMLRSSVETLLRSVRPA